MTPEMRMSNQYGLISRCQALESGLTENRVRYLVRSKQWIRVHRSVFRHASTPQSWRQAVMAATLATGGVASHRTVVRLLDLASTSGRTIEITTDHASTKRSVPGVLSHRSTQWQARQQTTYFGISCTGIERTVIDAAGTTTVNQIERIAEEAVRRRLTSFRRLARFLVMHGRSGRTGSANLRAMLLRRDPAAALPLSDFSRAASQLIADAGLAAPTLEVPILARDGSFIMQADLVWPDQRKIVELDGLTWHFGRDDVERDRRKRARARSEGWRIQEVLWSMYRDDRQGLIALLRDFLEA